MTIETMTSVWLVWTSAMVSASCAATSALMMFVKTKPPMPAMMPAKTKEMTLLNFSIKTALKAVVSPKMMYMKR